jgi:prevent-host-death family protein
MTLQSMLTEPCRVPEPKAAQEYSDVLTQVAQEGKTVIVSRNGADLAAVIPMEQLELVRELLARQEAEKLAAQIDWNQPRGHLQPPQAWFDDMDNPFEPA